jgi:hypothetical protein
MLDASPHGCSKEGVELTDEVVEQMAREGQNGLDISGPRRRPGRPAMGSGPADSRAPRSRVRKALDRRAAPDNTTASDVVREALRRYLEVS